MRLTELAEVNWHTMGDPEVEALDRAFAKLRDGSIGSRWDTWAGNVTPGRATVLGRGSERDPDLA